MGVVDRLEADAVWIDACPRYPHQRRWGRYQAEVGALIRAPRCYSMQNLCTARDCISARRGHAARQRMAQGVQLAQPAQGSHRGKLAQWQLKRVLGYIDANLESRIRTEDLARLARLSTSHFTRSSRPRWRQRPPPTSFPAASNSPCTLMANTGDELRAIATSCGMADQSHFCKVFRRVLASVRGSGGEITHRASASPPAAERSERLRVRRRFRLNRTLPDGPSTVATAAATRP